MSDLKSLLEEVERNWKFDPKKYPAMTQGSVFEETNFALTHGVLHVTKSGVPLTMELLSLLLEIATDSERAQHSVADMSPERRQEWEVRVAKLLVTVLGFAVTLEMSPENLEQRIAAILAANN